MCFTLLKVGIQPHVYSPNQPVSHHPVVVSLIKADHSLWKHFTKHKSHLCGACPRVFLNEAPTSPLSDAPVYSPDFPPPLSNLLHPLYHHTFPLLSSVPMYVQYIYSNSHVSLVLCLCELSACFDFTFAFCICLICLPAIFGLCLCQLLFYLLHVSTATQPAFRPLSVS